MEAKNLHAMKWLALTDPIRVMKEIVHLPKAVATRSLALVISIQQAAAADFEAIPRLQAAALLGPEWLKSDFHSVEPEVDAGKPFYRYRLTSAEGTIEIDGTDQLKARVREIQAIAKLRKQGTIVRRGEDSSIRR